MIKNQTHTSNNNNNELCHFGLITGQVSQYVIDPFINHVKAG